MGVWQNIDAVVTNRFVHILIAAISLFVVVAIPYIFIVDGHDNGAEPQIIAEALAADKGFSYPAKEAWLCSHLCQEAAAPDSYAVSAWADPVYPYMMAGVLSFGGLTAMQKSLRVVGVLAFAATLFLVGQIGHRLAGPWAGLAAALFLLLVTRNYATALNPAALSAAIVALVMYLLIRYGETLSLKQSAGIGGLLGVNVLTWSSGLVFIPTIAAYLLVMGSFTRQAALRVGVMAMVAAVLIVPWSVRNYMAFDEFVPVRNGVGYIAWIGTVGATGTYAPERIGAEAPPPWRSDGPLDAITTYSYEVGSDARQELEDWQTQIMDERLGETGAGWTEAQRDKWYFDEAFKFVLDNPGTAITLGLVKLHIFMMSVDMPVAALWPLALLLSIVTYFGVLGAFLFVKKQPALIVPLMMAWAFILPFVFLSPFFYRYRQPSEPAIAILVGVSFVFMVTWIWQSAFAQEVRKRFLSSA